MTISKDDLLKRKEEIVTDYNNLVAQIQKGESEIKDMKNNLNALAGALQQTDLFIKQIEDQAINLSNNSYIFTDNQAKAILDLRLHKLTSLERDNIKKDLQIYPVKWIDNVLEIALESLPTALSEEDYNQGSSDIRANDDALRPSTH